MIVVRLCVYFAMRTKNMTIRDELYKKHMTKCKLLFPKFKAKGEHDKARKVYLIMQRIVDRRNQNV